MPRHVVKRRAPNAHTFLEVIRARYGAVTHIVFMVFGVLTNVLVTSMLLTGGSAVVTSVCTSYCCQVIVELTLKAYRDANCCGLFPLACRRCTVHHVRWYQSYFLDRLW